MDTYHRIQKAVNYIESRLDQKLHISAIADNACYSPFHFQRLFLAITGYTVQEYITKRRLTEAAARLQQQDIGVLDAAVGALYGSQEAFTRAFENYTGSTPGKFRKDKPAFGGLAPIRLDAGSLPRRSSQLSIDKPEFLHFPDKTLIGVEYRTNLNDDRHYSSIPGFYDDFGRNGRFAHIPGKIAPDMNVGAACHFADNGDFSFVIGEETNPEADAPEGYVKLVIPGGLYAVFKVQSFAAVPDVRDYIYGVWLPSSKYERREGPDYEVTDVLASHYPDRLRMKIYIPVSG